MTPIDITNSALSLLGEPPIHGFDPLGTLPQRMAYLHYHPVRREVLCILAPEFAQRTETIGTFAEPDGKTALPHTLPDGCLRVLKVSPSEAWTLRSRQIFSPHKLLEVSYIYDQEDTELFEEHFTNIFALRLATKMCIPLVNSTTLRNELMESYTKFTTPNQTETPMEGNNPLYNLWRKSLTK